MTEMTFPTPPAKLPNIDEEKLPEGSSISLVGMAGVGKTTIGTHLAQALGWPQLDTDRLIESYYGVPLQRVLDGLGTTKFREAEEAIVSTLGARRCVISTGGSVVYGPKAIKTLRDLGPVIFLKASFETVTSRINAMDSRGLAILPGQTFRELFDERQQLYTNAAHHIIYTDGHTPASLTSIIINTFTLDS